MQTSFVSNNQSATIVEPGKTSFDAPSLGIARCRKARRLTAFSTSLVFSGRNARFDAAFRQLAPESGTVKAFIGDQFLHSGSGASALLSLDGDRCQCSARKADFVRLRALAKQTYGQAVAVRHEHYFTAFSNLGAPDSIPPF